MRWRSVPGAVAVPGSFIAQTAKRGEWRPRTDLAAHRHAARVGVVDELARRRAAAHAAEVPGEEADDRPRAAGGVGLAARERGEDRVAGVLFGPGDREAAGVRADHVADLPRRRGVVVPLKARPALH